MGPDPTVGSTLPSFPTPGPSEVEASSKIPRLEGQKTLADAPTPMDVERPSEEQEILDAAAVLESILGEGDPSAFQCINMEATQPAEAVGIHFLQDEINKNQQSPQTPGSPASKADSQHSPPVEPSPYDFYVEAMSSTRRKKKKNKKK